MPLSLERLLVRLMTSAAGLSHNGTGERHWDGLGTALASHVHTTVARHSIYRLPREAAESPSLEIFQTCLDKVLYNLL